MKRTMSALLLAACITALPAAPAVYAAPAYSVQAAQTDAASFPVSYGAPVVRGDVNADGVLNVSDVVALQKWLVRASGKALPDWNRGDLCRDGRLDAADLCLMKQALLGESPSEPVTLHGLVRIDLEGHSSAYAAISELPDRAAVRMYVGDDVAALPWDQVTYSDITVEDTSVAGASIDPVRICGFAVGQTTITCHVGNTTVIFDVEVYDSLSQTY